MRDRMTDKDSRTKKIDAAANPVETQIKCRDREVLGIEDFTEADAESGAARAIPGWRQHARIGRGAHKCFSGITA
jgi:hypothetical protein